MVLKNNNNNNVLTRKQLRDLKKYYGRNWFKFAFKVIILFIKNLFKGPFDRLGVHFISGYSGSGKTLLMSKIINRHCGEYDFYYTNKDQFDKTKTKSIEFLDLFELGRQVKKLPKTQCIDGKIKYCKGLILDEINATFNRRMNKTTEYNNAFVGLMQLCVTHRHQGLPRIYFMGQFFDFQDTQLQTCFKYTHEIASRRLPSYSLYKEKGNIEYPPFKMKIVSNLKTKEYDTKGQPLFIKWKTTRLKITYKDISSYNHLGFADEYLKLPDIDSKPLKWLSQ